MSSRLLVSWFPCLLVLLLALGLRLLLWIAPLHQPANDEIEYVTVARDLLAGRGWQFYERYHWLRAPLYPLWLAGSLWLAGGDPNSAAALYRAALPNIALSVLNVYLTYRLTLALAGRRAALLAALLMALLWTQATFASLYMAETLFTALFTAGLVCLTKGSRAENQEPPDTRHATRDTRHATRKSNPNLCNLRNLWITDRPELRVALAGVLFGLATLTRSITLLFLPVIVLWLLLQEPRTKNREPDAAGRFLVLGSWFLPALVFLLAAALTIAPWTIRNYQAYGRFILVETGLSYNLWAFNEPREDADTIFRALEGIANPAERADYATAKGLARLREDPAIVLRKLWPNWVYLARVKPIEDRFLLESYYGDVPLPLFAAALLFDDALYLAIALAGIAGLTFYGGLAGWHVDTFARLHVGTFQCANVRTLRARPKALLIGWLLYAIGTMLLTHGEARYRHFLFPVLIPCAAWALTELFGRQTRDTRHATRDTRHAAEGHENRPTDDTSAIQNSKLKTQNSKSSGLLVCLSACLLVSLALAGTFLAHYPWEWARRNLVRGWYAACADLAWLRGDAAEALWADEQALAADLTPDGWLRLGGHARATGDTARARDAYQRALELRAGYTPAVARMGDLLRAEGDLVGARMAFSRGFVDLQQLTDWSWRVLRPTARTQLAVGDGLDFGYVGGMYPAEQLVGAPARWTNGRGLLRFGGAAPAGQRGLLRLRLAAPWPGQASVPAQVCAGGQCTAIELGPTWRTYVVPLELAPGDAPVFELRSATFAAPDGRRLGVVVSAVAWAPRDESH